MAAVICQSVGKLCHGCVEALAWPCKMGCACCGKSCGALQDVVCSPFVPYLTTTLVLNVAPAMYGLRALTSCDNNATWLTVNGLLAAVHIVGAIYIVCKIQADDEPQVTTAYAYAEDGELGNNNNKVDGPKVETKYNNEALHKIFPTSATKAHPEEEGTMAGSLKRMGHVMCHDVGVAIYILAAAFWCFWQLFGVASLAKANDQENKDGSCNAGEWIITSLVCGFLYTVLVFCAFGCSFFCLR